MSNPLERVLDMPISRRGLFNITKSGTAFAVVSQFQPQSQPNPINIFGGFLEGIINFRNRRQVVGQKFTESTQTPMISRDEILAQIPTVTQILKPLYGNSPEAGSFDKRVFVVDSSNPDRLKAHYPNVDFSEDELSALGENCDRAAGWAIGLRIFVNANLVNYVSGMSTYLPGADRCELVAADKETRVKSVLVHEGVHAVSADFVQVDESMTKILGKQMKLRDGEGLWANNFIVQPDGAMGLSETNFFNEQMTDYLMAKLMSGPCVLTYINPDDITHIDHILAASNISFDSFCEMYRNNDISKLITALGKGIKGFKKGFYDCPEQKVFAEIFLQKDSLLAGIFDSGNKNGLLNTPFKEIRGYYEDDVAVPECKIVGGGNPINGNLFTGQLQGPNTENLSDFIQ